MARISCDLRYLLIPAAFMFIYVQMRLFQTQSNYADRLGAAIESENHCTSQMRSLIDEVSIKQSRILSLQDLNNRQDQQLVQLKDLVHSCQRKGIANLIQGQQMPLAALVIMACNRADYLERTVKSVLKYQTPIASKFPLFVSQDGSNQAVKSKALSYNQLTYMQHLDFEPVITERPGEIIAYYKIARHYKWALDQLFYKHKFNHVIILEDDMEIAPDFFDYFEAAASLMERDKTIMAASSWNDNGQKQFVHDPYALYRSDFFPGLGWMLKKSTWDELSPKWPKAYWDDWLRLKENHKGRHFVRPEVCRTYNFGEHGSSLGLFFSQYLEPIKLNDVKVDWKAMDLGYLTEGNYTKYMSGLVRQARPIQGPDLLLKAQNVGSDVRIRYKDQPEFERIAGEFGIFQQWKDGVPRTAYKGIVVFRIQTTRRVFLVGPDSEIQLGIQTS